MSPCVNVASWTFHLSGGKDGGMRRKRTGTALHAQMLQTLEVAGSAEPIFVTYVVSQ